MAGSGAAEAALAQANRLASREGDEAEVVAQYLKVYALLAPDLVLNIAARRGRKRTVERQLLDKFDNDGLSPPSRQEQHIATALARASAFGGSEGARRLSSLAKLVTEVGPAGVPTFITAWRLLRRAGRQKAADRLASSAMGIDGDSRRNRLNLRLIRQMSGTLPLNQAEFEIEEFARGLGSGESSVYSMTELGGKSRGVHYVRRHSFASPGEPEETVSLIEKCFDASSDNGTVEEVFYRADFARNDTRSWSAPKLIGILCEENRRRLFLSDVGQDTAPEDPQVRFAALADGAAQFVVDTAGSAELPLARTSIIAVLDWLADAAEQLEAVSEKTAIRADAAVTRLIDDVRRIVASRHRLEELASMPLVLGHGDLHTGNVIWRGHSPCFIDWGHFGYLPLGWDLAWGFWSQLVHGEPAHRAQMQSLLAERYVGRLEQQGYPAWRTERAQRLRDIWLIAALGALKVTLERRILARLSSIGDEPELEWNRTEARRFRTMTLAARYLVDTLTAGNP